MEILKQLAKIFKKQKDVFPVADVFGCQEKPPQNCPTFLERNVHQAFKNAIGSYNIIVVYGESRQGKTWTIEKYCPNQIRIGCQADMTLNTIKTEMLNCLGVKTYSCEHSVTEEISKMQKKSKSRNESAGLTLPARNNMSGAEIPLSATRSNDKESSQSIKRSETLTTLIPAEDLTQTTEFFRSIKDNANGAFFVFDNFHYLDPDVQKQFCALLKEFNYQNIKIIIVGVWKDASRITALASDLGNRSQHIDIGTWSNDELNTVLERGEKALNVSIDDSIASLFQNLSVNNIGIYKDFVQRFLQGCKIYSTQEHKVHLCDEVIANEVIKTLIDEAYRPLHDRIVNLALPQKKRRNSKYMRLKIILAILRLICESEEATSNGFSLLQIKETIDLICRELNTESIDISNLTQELGVLHLRKENKQTDGNYISLFYFDKANSKLLVLEPSIFEIKAYSTQMLEDIAHELRNHLVSQSNTTASNI